MGDARGLGRTDFLELNWFSASILEQRDTFAEQYVNDVKIYFVQQSSS